MAVPKLSYLGEHSKVSHARSLHACWTRMLYHDKLETTTPMLTGFKSTKPLFYMFWVKFSKASSIFGAFQLIQTPLLDKKCSSLGAPAFLN